MPDDKSRFPLMKIRSQPNKGRIQTFSFDIVPPKHCSFKSSLYYETY